MPTKTMPYFTFPLFNSLPLEIHSLIFSFCSPNDFTCLSLTCKYLYDLSQTFPQAKTPVSITNIEAPTPLCTRLYFEHEYNISRDRYSCHAFSYAEAVRRANLARLPPPPPAPVAETKCIRGRWAVHCECFSPSDKLHARLRTWMPRGLNYCETCQKFTRRKRGHRGRCYHGGAKPRKRAGNYWTYRKGRGGFAWQLWKKWFNNRAMDLLEKRLGVLGERRGRERYVLRKLVPKRVETRPMRV